MIVDPNMMSMNNYGMMPPLMAPDPNMLAPDPAAMIMNPVKEIIHCKVLLYIHNCFLDNNHYF